jgi:hypothetical protein
MTFNNLEFYVGIWEPNRTITHTHTHTKWAHLLRNGLLSENCVILKNRCKRQIFLGVTNNFSILYTKKNIGKKNSQDLNFEQVFFQEQKSSFMLLLRSSLGWGRRGDDLRTKKHREWEIHDTYVYGFMCKGKGRSKGVMLFEGQGKWGWELVTQVPKPKNNITLNPKPSDTKEKIRSGFFFVYVMGTRSLPWSLHLALGS